MVRLELSPVNLYIIKTDKFLSGDHQQPLIRKFNINYVLRFDFQTKHKSITHHMKNGNIRKLIAHC